MVEGTRFEIRQIDIIGAWVQIPPSPPIDILFFNRMSYVLEMRHFYIFVIIIFYTDFVKFYLVLQTCYREDKKRIDKEKKI